MINEKLMAIINLNEDNITNQKLTKNRPLASLPIAGRYRLIDFILSNIANSGIRNVGIFTQRKTRSLYDHLGDGATWDLDRLKDGLFIFSQQHELHEKFIRGDINIIYENIDYIINSTQEYILITTPYMIYNIDFDKIYRNHLESEAKMTTLYKCVQNADRDFYRCTVYKIDGDKIASIGENIGSEKEKNISLNAVIMKKDDFVNLIYKNIETGENLYIEDALNKELLNSEVNLYNVNCYVKCVDNTRSYVEFSKDILNANISNEIFKNPNNLIYTKIKDEAPTYFSDTSSVENSIISSGSIIDGNVKHSIISRKVVIGEGAIVENCIILQNTIIEKNTYLKHIICDKNSIITSGKKLIGDFNMPIVINKGEKI